jgi:Zn-dependent peptidase ImmA (M78 family)
MGFRCTQSDMVRTAKGNADANQEVQANRFAIELLAPPRFLHRYRSLFPDLDHVLEMAM